MTSQMTHSLRWLRQNALLVTGIVLTFAFIFVAIFADLVAPHSPNAQNLAISNRPPFWIEGSVEGHLLGTDRYGRDLLSRILHGARVSAIIGIAAVTLQALIGVTLGLIAGYSSRFADSIIMRIADAWLAIPFLVMALGMAVVLGPGLLNTIIVLAVVGWVGYARVVRAEVLTLREHGYVIAARTIGASRFRIITRHLLPNVMPSILVIGTFQMSTMIVAEASLSFLGMGIQPPTPAWGSMIAEGRGLLSLFWWQATLPGIALLFAVLGLYLIGDEVRDRLDPALKRR